MQKVEVTFNWWDLNAKGTRMWTTQNRTGLYIGNMRVGEFYLSFADNWVIILNGKEIDRRQLTGRQEAENVLLTAAKQLLKIEG